MKAGKADKRMTAAGPDKANRHPLTVSQRKDKLAHWQIARGTVGAGGLREAIRIYLTFRGRGAALAGGVEFQEKGATFIRRSCHCGLGLS